MHNVWSEGLMPTVIELAFPTGDDDRRNRISAHDPHRSCHRLADDGLAAAQHQLAEHGGPVLRALTELDYMAR